MADSQRIFDPGKPFLDANSNPLGGGTIYFYLAGTSTPLTVYSDADLTQSLGVSVSLDSGGFPVTGGTTLVAIYTGTQSYKIVIKTSAGAPFATYDNLKGALDTSGYTTTYAIQTSPVLSKTAAYTVTTNDKGKHIACDPTGGSFALTLPSAITAGDGFIIEASHNADSDNPVSILPQAGQTVGGKASLVLTRRQSAMLVSDGANWRIKSARRPFYESLFRVTDRLTAAPSSPVAGAKYIINGTPTGTWSTLGFAQHDVVESDGNGGWIQWVPQDGWQAYVIDENLVSVFVDTAWTDWSNVTAPTTSALKCAVYEDFKSNGTAGGSATTGSYQTRTLNTEVKNTITGVSLASNQITLPPGTYLIHFWQVLYNVGASASKIKVISGTATPTNIYASWSNHALTDAGGDVASIYDATPSTGILTVTATAVIELQYYVASTAGGTSALGLASAEPDGSGETYARVTLVELTSIQGPAGSQGTQGTDGLDASYAYQWSTSTSGDPGSGKIAGNNATIASITQIAISETDAAGASLGSAVLGSWDDSTSSVKARLIIQKEGATQNRHEFLISGAGTDQGTYWTFPVTYVATGGTISNGDSVAVNVIEKGDKGDTGATGSAGSTGATGATGATGPNTGLDFAFNTATSGDPGSGKVLFNNATPASVTQINISKTGRNAESLGTLIGLQDDSTNTAHRGHLRIFTVSDRTKFIEVEYTSAFTDNTTYWSIPVSSVSGSGTLPANNDVLAVMFERTGNKGADGAGTGDASGPASATDNALARFDGTTGKLIQNSGAILDDSNNLSGLAATSTTTIELGHASDTTLSRSAAGKLAVEGVAVALNSTTADPHIAASIELGHATDTTLARSSAGVMSVEGETVHTNSISRTITAAGIELGHASDTTLSRSSAGVLAVEGVTVSLNSTSSVHTASSIELGNASDTTISRDSAGIIAVEGVPLYSQVPQNSKSTAYTTVLADAQKHILHPSSDNNARTFTIDSNANVAYPIGTTITFINMINTVTIAITSDTLTLMGSGSTGSRTLAANGIATAIKIGSTSWVINGTGLT